MRKKYFAGNWKMNLNRADAIALAEEIKETLFTENKRILLAPPFPYLEAVGRVLEGSSIELGAQNMFHETSGAFTGEVSPTMLRDLKATTVILGHSERRQYFGETDEFVLKKVKTALKNGLQVILCIGETLKEREEGIAEKVVLRQLCGGLEGVNKESLENITIAYEPVWAIGTGKVATPEDAETIHALIRKKLGELYSSEDAERMIIQYGGSVKPDNISGLMNMPNIDGALIGGASLKAKDFYAIVTYDRHL